MRQLAPAMSLIAFLVNPTAPETEPQLKEVEEAAHSIGQQIRILKNLIDQRRICVGKPANFVLGCRWRARLRTCPQKTRALRKSSSTAHVTQGRRLARAGSAATAASRAPSTRAVAALEPDLVRPVSVREAHPVVLSQLEAAARARIGHDLGAWNAVGIKLIVPGRVERVSPIDCLPSRLISTICGPPPYTFPLGWGVRRAMPPLWTEPWRASADGRMGCSDQGSSRGLHNLGRVREESTRDRQQRNRQRQRHGQGSGTVRRAVAARTSALWSLRPQAACVLRRQARPLQLLWRPHEPRHGALHLDQRLEHRRCRRRRGAANPEAARR